MRGKQWEASGKRREETEGARAPPAASTERNRRRTELARLRQALEPRPDLNAAGPSGLLRPKVEPAESPAAPIENIQDYLDVGETLISVPSRPPGSISRDIKTDIMVEIELEPVPLKNESAELLLEVKQEHKEDELRVKEEDSQEFKYSNTRDYLDIEETVICKPGEEPASVSTVIKDELLDSEDTMDEPITKIDKENVQMKEVPITVAREYLSGVEDDNPEHIIRSDIKQEPKSSADLELLKGGGSTQVALTRSPTNTHTDIKQEPMDVWQTDPDDVTTQSTPEGSEQNEMEDIKYLNTQDYLDIGETVISEQDRAMSEQDRARPGTSSKHNKSGTEQRRNKSEEKIEKLFKCAACDDWSTSRDDLKKHMRTHTEEKPYTCEACNYRFTDKRHLQTHMKTHTGEKPYKCDTCDFRCAVSRSLKNHIRTHTGEKPYKCDACYRLFKCSSDLKKHKRIHSGEKPYKCNTCDYRCTVSSSLKVHMRMHNGEKPYKCDACDYRCAVSSTLKVHMRTHNGEKPYKCDACDYRCTVGSSLKKHIRTHNGEKPYKCDACDRLFKCNDDLKKHVRIHSGEKPYKCNTCDYRCTVSNSLKVHMRTHNGEKPYKCDTCDYRCAVSSSLKLHMRTHNGEKPYKCDACGYRCAVGSSLKVHMRTHKNAYSTIRQKNRRS